MGRSFVTRASNPKSRRTPSGLVAAGIAIVLLFAIVGVVSAGSYVANKVSSAPTSTATTASPSGGGKRASVQEMARAQAQATAIVKQALSASRTIVKSAGKAAERKAKAILAAAKQKSGPSGTSPNIAVATAGPASSSGLSPSIPGAPAAPPVAAATSVGPPGIAGLPAAWLVVAYNATFGNGPGTVGGVTVTNRGTKTLSGTVRVVYTSGGAATASFSRLVPGETRGLGLEGRAYGGGGYRILLLIPR